ncbi:MAG: hypothetical protein WKH64_10885, partial [Chloroflexia bacterium]
AAGLVIQIAAGVDFPTVPPGLVILLSAAALVAFVRQRWTSVVAVGVAAFLLVGLTLSGQVPKLFDTEWLGRFIGLWVLFLALIVVAVAGIVVTIENYRTRS